MQSMQFHLEPAVVYDQKQHLPRHLIHKYLTLIAVHIVEINVNRGLALN
jgi:hypothetical protein